MNFQHLFVDHWRITYIEDWTFLGIRLLQNRRYIFSLTLHNHSHDICVCLSALCDVDFNHKFFYQSKCIGNSQFTPTDKSRREKRFLHSQSRFYYTHEVTHKTSWDKTQEHLIPFNQSNIFQKWTESDNCMSCCRWLQTQSQKYRNTLGLKNILAQCIQDNKCFVCNNTAEKWFFCAEHAKNEVPPNILILVLSKWNTFANSDYDYFFESLQLNYSMYWRISSPFLLHYWSLMKLSKSMYFHRENDFFL